MSGMSGIHPRFAIALSGNRRHSSSASGWSRVSSRDRNSTSAGIPRWSWSARAIGIVIARLPDRTSETFARLPMNGISSRGLRPACSMRNSMAATGSGVSHRLVPALVQIDEIDQHVEFTAFGATGLGIHEFVDPRQRGLVVRLGPNRLDVGHLHTSLASTASYSACVPTNRT